MNAAKHIVLKENKDGIITEMKKYYKTKAEALADIKYMNRRAAKVTQIGNTYKLKKKAKKK